MGDCREMAIICDLSRSKRTTTSVWGSFPFSLFSWLVLGRDFLLRPCDSVLGLLLRFSSVQLLGDLLFHISGVTGKMTTETASEDDNFGTAQSNKVHSPS